MRSLEAVIVSLTCSVASFLSVSTVLDENPLARLVNADTGRLTAFASPDLAPASLSNMTSLRPFPATIAPVEEARREPSGVRARHVPPLRSAHVPPIVRRQPKEPDATLSPLEAATKPSKVASSAAKAGKPQALSRPSDFDTSTRSTLGGPRLGAPVVAPPPKRKAQPRPTTPLASGGQ